MDIVSNGISHDEARDINMITRSHPKEIGTKKLKAWWIVEREIALNGFYFRNNISTLWWSMTPLPTFSVQPATLSRSSSSALNLSSHTLQKSHVLQPNLPPSRTSPSLHDPPLHQQLPQSNQAHCSMGIVDSLYNTIASDPTSLATSLTSLVFSTLKCHILSSIWVAATLSTDFTFSLLRELRLPVYAPLDHHTCWCDTISDCWADHESPRFQLQTE